MSRGLRLGLGLTRRQGGALNPVAAIFADGTDGFYFDFSKLDQSFQETSGQTLSDDPGESIGLHLDQHGWGGLSLTAMIAAQPELVLNGGFDTTTTNWEAVQSATLSSVAGELVVTGGGVVFAQGRQSFATTSGRTYLAKVTARLGTAANSACLVPENSSAANIHPVATASTSNTTPTPLQIFFTAPNSSSYLALLSSGAPNGKTLIFDNASCKLVPGNHGQQSTAAAKPSRQAAGVARFDGSDDALLTTLLPSAAFTLIFKAKITSGSRVLVGSTIGGSQNAYFGLNANGYFAAAVGGSGFAAADAVDMRGTLFVGAITYDGANVKFYKNGALINTISQSGAPNSTVPFTIGANNSSGTQGSFADADLSFALAIKKALSATEIAAITNLWGMT